MGQHIVHGRVPLDRNHNADSTGTIFFLILGNHLQRRPLAVEQRHPGLWGSEKMCQFSADVLKRRREILGQSRDRNHLIEQRDLLDVPVCLLLVRLLCRDIARDAFQGNQIPRIVANEYHPLLHPDHPAILMEPADLERSGAGRTELLNQPTPIIRMHQFQPYFRMGIELLRPITENVQQGRADILALERGNKPIAKDNIRRIVGQLPEPLFARAQRQVHLLAFSYVPADIEHTAFADRQRLYRNQQRMLTTLLIPNRTFNVG